MSRRHGMLLRGSAVLVMGLMSMAMGRSRQSVRADAAMGSCITGCCACFESDEWDCGTVCLMYGWGTPIVCDLGDATPDECQAGGDSFVECTC